MKNPLIANLDAPKFLVGVQPGGLSFKRFGSSHTIIDSIWPSRLGYVYYFLRKVVDYFPSESGLLRNVANAMITGSPRPATVSVSSLLPNLS
jgi:hypothetical protein